MRPLTQLRRTKVLSRVHAVIEGLLEFHVAYSAAIYINERAQDNWREFEGELHVNYPIKGVGIIATPDNLDEIYEEDGGFLHAEEDLYPGEVTTHLPDFPYQAASAAYIFTVMEELGNDLVQIVNPGYRKKQNRNWSWHSSVYGDLKLKDQAKVLKAKEGLAKALKVDSSRIADWVIERLATIKKARNAYAHEGDKSITFDGFFADVVSIICVLQFLLLPHDKQIKIYPYYDYHGKWTS